MKRFEYGFLSQIRSFFLKLGWSPWLILAVCVLAYGIMIPWLGLYSDDWIYLSSFHKFGVEGLTRYFSTNRPVWGLIYQLTLPILGITPWHWHVFGLFWHAAAAISLWWLITLIWHNQESIALWAGLLFAIYPGFVLQPISITFGHIFLIYTAYLLSSCFLILAYQQPNRFWLFTILALFTSAINLFCMEYFLLLHLLQPAILWYVLQKNIPDYRLRLKRLIKIWWPYFLLFIGDLIWRTIFFKYQTNNYQYLFLDRLKNGVGPAIIYLLRTMLKDWWNTTINVWIKPLRTPFELQGNNIDIVYLVITFISTVLLFYVIYKFTGNIKGKSENKHNSIQIFTLGSLALIFAGGPFWLTELDVSQIGFRSRFSLPFIFGAVLVISSLLQLFRKHKALISAILAVLIGFSIGYQIQMNNDFRREWIIQKNLYWQLAWRIPDLEPGTTIFISEMPELQHISHAIISSTIDWNFHPVTSATQMDYAVYYPRELEKNLEIKIEPDLNFQYDHLGAIYNGNTSKNITIHFVKDNLSILNCAHVMSPSVDGKNPYLSDEEKKVTKLSDPNLIKTSNVFDTNKLFPQIFGEGYEVTHCYYFEKADLAYQLGEWNLAIDMYNQDSVVRESNWIDTELVPVIGSYAQLGNWEKAYSYSILMSSRTYFPATSVICSLWNSLEKDTPDGLQKQEFIKKISSQFDCQN